MKLADLFTDHMVLQRRQPIRIFGQGRGRISITFLGRTSRFEALAQEWCFELPAEEAGGPYQMELDLDGRIVRISQVWIGEVWLASGQSNMEMALRLARHRPEELPAWDDVGFFEVRTDNAGQRRWRPCSGRDYLGFSAIGCFFAFKLRREHGVPVGIISCCRGASCIESWIDKGLIAGTRLELPTEQRHVDAVKYPFNAYGELHDLLLRTLMPYALRGVLWYQGESNRGIHDGRMYADLLRTLVSSWRDGFRAADLPFLIVQITAYGESTAQYGENWARIRQQQLIAARTIANTAMVTTTDLGERDEIHPSRKEEVAQRLFLAAQSLVYGRDVEYAGPLFERADFDGDEAVVHFSHAEGLRIDGPSAGILACAADGRYEPATAVVDGRTLRVRSGSGREIAGIHYGYVNFPSNLLWNAAGLPASPFLVRKDGGDGEP